MLGMVTDVGGLGDHAFNDSAYAGLLRTHSALGINVNVLQSHSAADYQPNLTALVDLHCQTIVGVGFLMGLDLDLVAKEFPRQQFAIIDGDVSDPNVVSITFREQDGSFLAGALAAMVSKTRHIGFIGGLDIPLITKFEAGYVAGARQVDPSIKVDVAYAGSFDDVAAGESRANALFGGGADIVYVAAGKAGLGAIDAVKTRSGDYVIGVDSDQDALAPGKVLTSMLKKVDVAVFEVGQALLQRRHLNGHMELGLGDGAIALTDFRYTKAVIGSANLTKLASLERAIVAGRIKPPSTRVALASFVPVTL